MECRYNTQLSGVVGQKVGRAKSCNFPMDTTNFRQN